MKILKYDFRSACFRCSSKGSPTISTRNTMSKKTKTPKKTSSSDDSSLCLSPTLSPVFISPGRSPYAGNLTGSARKVKDAAADWHNYTSKWRMLKSQGSEIIQQISNIKLEAIYSKESADLDESDGKEPVQIMPMSMEKYTEKLLDIHSSLTKIVQKLENLTRVLKGVSDLEWLQHNESFSEEPLFKSWQINQFHEVSTELLSMYEKELRVKEAVVENIAHTTDRDTIMTLSAAWIHEPYIDARSELLLESLLHETGHR